MTGQEYVNKCKADLCKTQSRSKNGKKYHNKYTEYFGKLGYPGINKSGVFTKKYSYGVVGHCCIGAQYHLHKNGLKAFVPKKAYIWNTNTYRKWLKSEPTIKGYGKVDWVTSPSKAKVGAIAFKGNGKNKKSATHTCVFIKAVGNYVYTVDFNVGDGKGHNNGTLHKRHKKYFLGFANMPYPKAPEPPTVTKYRVTTNGSNLYVRHIGSASGKKIASIKNGTVIEVTTIKDGWAYVPEYKGWCSTRWIKKV